MKVSLPPISLFSISTTTLNVFLSTVVLPSFLTENVIVAFLPFSSVHVFTRGPSPLFSKDSTKPTNWRLALGSTFVCTGTAFVVITGFPFSSFPEAYDRVNVVVFEAALKPGACILDLRVTEDAPSFVFAGIFTFPLETTVKGSNELTLTLSIAIVALLSTFTDI